MSVHLICLVEGAFHAEPFTSIELAAQRAYDILAQNGEGCECLHTIRDADSKVLWKYEGAQSMIKLFKLIYEEGPTRRRRHE